ncbi:MAG TPA: metalloregulator ArsR/SmtB family transcription factor [Myxococcaceae bacterium]|nr:metalloregulator ArsR/SmtB family transcription factor [Myxococcaceae bacterium]
MKDARAPQVYSQLSALADPTRGRLLLALDRQELAVTELASALRLPQSTVSRHLRTLADEGWISARAEGTSRRYRMATESLPGSMRRLWAAVKEPVSALPGAAEDSERLREVLAARRDASQAFFHSAAGRWDRLRAELFGSQIELVAPLGLLDEGWVVGDLGCGTGAVSQALAGAVAKVIAVDGSRAMLAAAKQRLADEANVELRAGELEALPVEDEELDAALLVLVLHHVPTPAAALAEAARALKPGGRLVVVDMLPHDREAYRDDMGHVWLGLPTRDLQRWLREAGLEPLRTRTLPPVSGARGPPLFLSTARKRPPARRASRRRS